MRRTNLTSTNSALFEQAWHLYLDSFPIDERRDLPPQARIMQHEAYHFDVFTDEQNTCIGFILWWEFDNVIYIEHFATAPALRGKGIGEDIMTKFTSGINKTVLLEVEIPEAEIQERRIEFYKRIGFKLNTHPYTQPAYRTEGNPVELLIMTYPKAISEHELAYFTQKCHPVIHAETLNK